MPPNANQIRNAHSYLKDYLLEKRLYERIYEFVSDLNSWKCDKNTIQGCFIDCIQHLVNKKHLNANEIHFYKVWIDDLNNLGYKWPKLDKIISDSDDEFLFYKSVEKEHSSNSGQNEISTNMLTKRLEQMKTLEKECLFKIDFTINPCIFEKLILITQATSVADLKYLISIIYLHFPYTIICINNKTLFESFISANPHTTSYTILLEENFKECIRKSINIGFKQQSFVIAKHFRNFSYWSKSLRVVESKFHPLSPKSDENNFYLLRKNVANAFKTITFAVNSSNICHFYKNNLENLVCTHLNAAISNLVWHANDLASESCENIEASTVWIPEIHLGCTADTSTVLANLGQIPILAGRGYTNTKFKFKFPESVRVCRGTSQIAEVISSNNKYFYIQDEFIKSNYEYYKNSSDFKQVDFVVCSFYSALCELFIPLNKTIIFNPAHRYNLARCENNEWNKLNENYFMLKSKSKLVVASMSKYDQEYQGYFTGLFGYRLFAFSGYYTKNVNYMPNRSEILVGPANFMSQVAISHLAELNSYSKNNNHSYKFVYIKNLYEMYSLGQLANHRAVVVFPYASMTYSIVEFYASKIPIFVPSVNMWSDITDRSIRYKPYCGNVSDIRPFKDNLHNYSPNDEGKEAYQYWVKYSDFYLWPHVVIFESWEDLIHKLNTLDLNKISNDMKDFNYVREADLLDNWCKILKLKDKQATIPESYEKALQYFGVSEFQYSN